MNLRDFLSVVTKLKESIFKNNNQNQIHCYSKNMGFANIMDQSMANYSIGIRHVTKRQNL